MCPALLRRVLSVLALLAICGGLAAPMLGQDAEVTTVKFINLRAPTGNTGNWMEAEVSVNVKPPAGAVRQMVSRVRVSLLVGYELPGVAGGDRRIEHFRAEAECVALEAGRADIRFYLPPEIVKRDQLRGDPKYWGVELAVAGRTLAPGRSAYSATLQGADQRKNFQTRGGQAASTNDGILLPQYLTPFRNEYPRATPSYVRREVR